MHDVLDPDSDRGRVYRCLVSHPRVSVGQLAPLVRLSESVVHVVLKELAAEDIVVTTDLETGEASWEALPPAEVVEALLQRDAALRTSLRQAGTELERLYRFARKDAGHYGALDVVEDPARVLAVSRQLQQSARHQIRVIDVPPYSGTSDHYLAQEVLQRERMAAGVVYRSIYHGSAFDDPIAWPNMARMIEAGEQARTLDDPPMKLAIGDNDLAVVTLAADDHPGVVSLLIRPSGLFQALSNVFESLWRLAVPISAAGIGTQIDARDRQILTLMASGATDDAIARHLGVGRRTVVRRVSALLARLGATTRFQAGVQAARRGWL
ncbi:LuxR C-terminal-related transcriptional regulator [Streptomyces netropsis]|uniref:DNA-binding CsgD family transcriptional regulator n=1 Tax=Streptomyces netropsis TaxID=55404 RepID=A0A7W7LCT0_STRNE|nr:LuxR C-terminal-related transcriptional regulator [Streptomyces netropsis]MBB4887321.1 DNA-binding CsgD family transcriptional regulator [Streptomyces netropsis]GGR09451.1 transcriptional regulator [Streptomyces netropsis]